MKSVNSAVTTAIRQDAAVKALPKLTVEWNMNRYFESTVDNTPAEDTNGNDIEMFPISSIISGIRPTKGVVKARVNEAIVADVRGSGSARFYVSSVDDKYKYWTSPGPSNGSGVISNVSPHVVYTNNVTINKIVVKLENTWASPTSFTIQTTTNGSSWSTIATNPTIQNNGSIILYWNGTSWSSTKPATLTATQVIRGVQIVVTQLGAGKNSAGATTTYRKKNAGSDGYTITNTTGFNSHFNLIELSARLEADLSDKLISVQDTFDISESSQIYPIGQVSANVGSITLWNGDGLFDADNVSSIYANMLEANVEVNLEYIYTIGGNSYPVQQFKFYTDDAWGGQKTETVSVPLRDFSKYLQEIFPRPSMWQGLTPPQIVERICDSIGFVDYVITQNDRTSASTIPVFWVDGTKTVWEVFNELSIATQTAIYFDAFGRLQTRTRQTAFDELAAPVWTIRGIPSGAEQTDLINISQNEAFEANKINVMYKTTKWSDFNNGVPAMQKVWEPEGTVVLRASNLQQGIVGGSQYIYVPPIDAKTWPYKGLVNIDGEIIRYAGKQFVYYTGASGTTRNVIVVESADDMKKYNEMTAPDYRWKNNFTGGLKITERGAWNSQSGDHPVDATGYTTRHIVGGTFRTGVGGFVHLKKDSKVLLNSGPRFEDADDLLVSTRGTSGSSGYYHYGTKMKFVPEKGRSGQRAGLVIHSNTNSEDGYYIEFTPTNKLGGQERGSRNEVTVWNRKSGVWSRLGGKGTAVAIAEDRFFEVDIHYSEPDGNTHKLRVWVNGKEMISVNVTGAARNTFGGRFGMYLRGKTKVQYEYLYAIARNDVPPLDDFSFLDRIEGSYVGNLWDREWVYKWRTVRRRRKKGWERERQRWNQYTFDEFGPIVHELREYDVAFDPKPVLHSRVYSTNDWEAAVLEYRADPFNAHFVVANTSRRNAVLFGEDAFNLAGDSQQLTVIGRPLVISDAETFEVKNENSILRRGEIQVDLESDWIQSKDMAEVLGKWIDLHWGSGRDGQVAQIFGNPVLELGDVVAVNYPAKNLTNVNYFITGISTNWNNGIETTLSLRRVN